MNRTIKLNNNILMPLIGYGTWMLNDQACSAALDLALECGYRLIDTAERYKNHVEVGKAIKLAGVNRADLFVTTKFWRNHTSAAKVTEIAHRSLEELQLDYLDMYMYHWPNRKGAHITETLKAMQALVDEGLVKCIGVSNFTVNHLEDAAKTGVKIQVNQVEYHPSLNQQELLDYCDKNKIVLQAYSPLAQGYDLVLGLIVELAQKYNKTPAQIILNWLICKDIAVLTKSEKLERMQESLQVQHWQLDQRDVNAIDAINTNNRLLVPPFSDFKY